MKPNGIDIPNKETRAFSAPIELRAAGEVEEKRTVFGYAAKFNSLSENLGTQRMQFREIIQPGAFDDVLKNDVRALLNHDPNFVLARSKGGHGTLRLGTDETGLWYEFEAPDTQAGRDLLESLRRGDVDQSSFSFTVDRDGEDWEERQEGDGPVIATRTIKRVSRLYDVSPVTFPAYSDATVALRSLEQFKAEHRQEEPNSDEKPTDEQLSEVLDWAARLGLNPAQSNKTN